MNSTKTVFISHASADKPFVYRLAFELLAEGVPVWLDKWDLGPGDPLISGLDNALDGSAQVLVVMSIHSAATEWVRHEVQRALRAEAELGRRLLVPVRIDTSEGLPGLAGRVQIVLSDGPGFMEGVHALIEHLRSIGLSTGLTGRCVLPLVFHRGIELDTFVLDRILSAWIAGGFHWSGITTATMHLLKSETYNELQRGLRMRTSTYMSSPDATAEALADLRRLDADIVWRERQLLHRSALVLREFGRGFGLANSHVIEVLRWYTRLAMHYLMCTLEATGPSNVTTIRAFTETLEALPNFKPDPSEAKWWNIDDALTLPVHHLDTQGCHHTTATVIVPRSGLRVSEDELNSYP